MNCSLLRSQRVFAREDGAGSDTLLQSRFRILIVEDDFLVASQVEMALSDAGFDVIGVAVSAEEAVARARRERPALIVMDVRLVGERDGIHAAVEIFQEFGTRCIFATAQYDEPTRDRAKSAMPLGWLQKPYSMAALVGTVRHALKELDDHQVR